MYKNNYPVHVPNKHVGKFAHNIICTINLHCMSKCEECGKN